MRPGWTHTTEWVGHMTHHVTRRKCHVTYMYTALDQTTDKLVEMMLDSAPKATPTTDSSPIPLVGTATTDEDGESDDSGSVANMEDYSEDDDPVSHMTLT